MQLDGRTIRIEGRAGGAELLVVSGYVRLSRGEAALYLNKVEGDFGLFIDTLRGWKDGKYVGKGFGVTVLVDGCRIIVEFEYESLEYTMESQRISVSGYAGKLSGLTQAEIAKLRELKGKA